MRKNGLYFAAKMNPKQSSLLLTVDTEKDIMLDFSPTQKLLEEGENLPEMQDLIDFDSALKRKAQLKQGLEPDERKPMIKILKYIQYICVFLYIFILPMYSIPQWCLDYEDNDGYKGFSTTCQ